MNSATSKEQALISSLLQSIQEARLRPGARLPVERNQMTEFDVSRTTVRRALQKLEEAGVIERRQGSGTYLKQQPSRAMIREVLDEENRLSRVGRRLLTQESRRIAVLHDHVVSTPVLERMLAGIRDYANQRGHTITVGPSRPPFDGEVPHDFSPQVYHSQADGMILIATFRPGDQQRLAAVRAPYVLLTDQPTANALSLDIQGACRQGIGELINLGHRRITVVEKHYANKRPTLGHVCDYLREEWSLPDLRYVYSKDPVLELLTEGSLPPALLVKDDVYCRQVCAQLKAKRIAIGRDVDVISLANRGLDPRLPASVGKIEFDLEELGRLSAQAVERSIDEGVPSPPLRVGGRYVAASPAAASSKRPVPVNA